jgi:hypothetical protein
MAIITQLKRGQTMATVVNSAITDSVTETGVQTLGVSPGAITSNLMQVASQATGLSLQNAVSGQQHSTNVHEATSTQGVSLLYMVDTAAEAQAVDTINRSTDYSKLIDTLGVNANFPTQKPQYG